jgi:type IV pilus assembly protein PilV
MLNLGQKPEASFMGGRFASHRRQCGVSMIEVLIALVLLAVGVLGIAGLQIISKRNNYDSAQRTISAALATNLYERMRANASQAALLQYLNSAAGGLGSGLTGSGQQGSEPSPKCASSVDTCNATQLAVHDVWYWEQQLDGGGETASGTQTGGLALPLACLTGPPGGGTGLYTLVIVWRGTTVLTDNAAVACGKGAKDGSGNFIYGTNGEYRRSATVTSYIIQQ